MEREDHQVTVVANGKEAINRARAEPFDIVLLDIVMPVLGGLQSVRYFRPPLLNKSVTVHPYVFALTAYDQSNDIVVHYDAGFDGVIAKPLQNEDLNTSSKTVKSGSRRTMTHIAADVNDAQSRLLLDKIIIRDGLGLPDDITRERIWRSYRQG